MKHLLALIFAIFLHNTSCIAQEQRFQPEWNSLKQHKAAPDWFADAKLGIYFHWGIYSVPATGGEWYPRWMYTPDRDDKKWGGKIYEQHRATYGEDFHYHDFIPQWKADKFDATEWVSLFEEAGAKIIGSIAEHHDGFSLWDSKVNEWNSLVNNPNIDVVGAIEKETRKRNLKFMTTFHHGFHLMFYPKQENTWLRPVSTYQFVYKDCKVPQDPKYAKLYGNMDWDEANDLWLSKLDEVSTKYSPDYIWMDFGQRFIKESYRKQFLANYFNTAHSKQQEVVVNTKGDFFPKDLAIVNVERATMPDITNEVWVTDFILGGGWCYNKDKRVAITPEKVIRMLAEVVSKNGVMLLSAGPKADGSIPEEQIATLKAMGKWLKLYGESIYNTRPFLTYGEGTTQLIPDNSDAFKEFGAIKKGLEKLNAEDIRYTQNGKTIYAIQLGWSDTIKTRTLKAFANKAKHLKIKKVSLLGSNAQVKWKKTSNGLQINTPNLKPLHADMAIVYKIEIR